MITKKHIYGKHPIPPNTFIGGVGSSLTTKNLLAAKLGIASTRIKSFRVVNNEVQAFIEGTYEIMTNTFIDDHTITHFKDNDRLVKRITNGCFANCSNLETLELYGLLDMSSGGSTKISNTKISHLYFPEMTSISGNMSIQNNLFLKTFDAPIATSIPQNAVLRNNPSLEYINIPNVKSQIGFTVLNNSTFDGCKSGCVINVDKSLMTINAGFPDADIYSNVDLDVNYIGYTHNPDNYNTEVGGLASTQNTRFLIGKTLGIGSSRVVDFSVSESDIRFRVLGNHNLNTAFRNNTSITYYKDNEGLCAQLNNNAFSFAVNLTEVYFPATTTLNTGTSSTSGVFNDCPNLTTINMPLLANMNGRRNFANTPLLKVMNFDNVIGGINVWTFQGSGIEHVSLPMVTSLGQEMFSTNTLTKILDAPLATDFAIRVFENANGLEIINIPSVENIPIKNQTFHNLTSLNLLNAKKLKYMGNPASVNGNGSAPMFNSLKLNCRIQVHVAMATVNSGSPDLSLIWAKTNRSAIVEFYDDNGNYVSTL